jgi:putative resolvase
MGISYRRAWQMFKGGKLPNAKQLPTGTIVVIEDDEESKPFESGAVAIYVRVLSHESADNLEKQAERLREYSLAKGYQIKHLVKEVGTGS